MRAARITAPGAARIEDAPRPEPGPGEVRVAVEGCGVCGSNLPLWEGKPWFDYPLAPGAPGHEGWGHVDAVGDSSNDSSPGVAEGDRVAFLSSRAFADFDVCDRDQLVVLPPELDGLPFPAEPLGCAMNVLDRSGIAEGHHVAVVGIGFLGALMTRLAAARGARVVGLSRRSFSRDVALRLGAEAAYDVDDAGVEAAREHTGGEGHDEPPGFDRVIECVGLQGPLDVATALTRVRGRLVVAGYHQDGPRTVDMRIWNWRGLDVVNAHERDPARYREGMRAAVEAVRDGTLDVDAVVTHRYRLDELDRALDDLRDRPDGFLKGVVVA